MIVTDTAIGGLVMNELQRRVFGLRADLWQLAEAGLLQADPGTDLAAIVRTADQQLHALEGVLRGLHVGPAPTQDDDTAALWTLAMEVVEKIGSRRMPIERVVELLARRDATGDKPSRLARDLGMGFDTVTKLLDAADEIQGISE